jgi:hypothetical protein
MGKALEKTAGKPAFSLASKGAFSKLPLRAFGERPYELRCYGEPVSKPGMTLL